MAAKPDKSPRRRIFTCMPVNKNGEITNGAAAWRGNRFRVVSFKLSVRTNIMGDHLTGLDYYRFESEIETRLAANGIELDLRVKEHRRLQGVEIDATSFVNEYVSAYKKRGVRGMWMDLVEAAEKLVRGVPLYPVERLVIRKYVAFWTGHTEWGRLALALESLL